MSKRAYAKTLPPKELTVEDAVKVDIEAQDKVRPVQKFSSLAEQLAKSTIFHRNWYVTELREKYKYADRMKRIDKVFPYARIKETETVMLFVDEPLTDLDLEICVRKSKLMQKMGYNYVYIEKDSTLYDLLEQLGVI